MFRLPLWRKPDSGQTAVPDPVLPANPKSPKMLDSLQRETKPRDSGDLRRIQEPTGKESSQESLSKSEIPEIDGAHQWKKVTTLTAAALESRSNNTLEHKHRQTSNRHCSS